MNANNVVFNKNQHPEFFSVLTRRVNDYFTENGIDRHANAAMKWKTFIIVVMYLTPLCWLISGKVNSLGMHYALWTLMGLGMVGIGLAIMHDANHGAYSRKKWVNEALGNLLNLVGAYHINWKIQHNVFHHTYTNIVGHDEDIRKTIIRFSPRHPHHFMHRFQAVYAVLLYMIYPFVWILSKDFEQYARYRKLNIYPRMGRSNRRALLEIIVIKLLYWPITLFLPLYMSPFGALHTLLGFFLHHCISGIILALATQPAHVGEDMEFYSAEDNNGSIENSWAIHQLKTTANFAERSRVLAWFIGGLNFQIEHHLFPNVCHVHYKNIAPIVRKTAEEYQLEYHTHPTFLDALKSHFGHLHELARPNPA